MNFAFSEDQDQIRQSVRSFVQRESSLDRVRSLTTDGRGWSLTLWRQMAESGWLGAVYPEEYGGVGLGYVDLICIAEELGRGLFPEPLISTAILAGNVILNGGTDEQKRSLLPPIAQGDLVVTLAALEQNSRYDLHHVETTATRRNDGFVIHGAKVLVPDAYSADKILVTARTDGAVADPDGITLFALERKEPGIEVTPIPTMDRRPRATLELDGVTATQDNVIGQVDDGFRVVARAVDMATVALCAEMIGGMGEALRMTTEYVQQRVQFGRPIGSFQAVKHKCANMYVTLEAAKSAMYYAAMAVDENTPDQEVATSCAKALCSEAFEFITKEALQLHGGIGFTDEHDIGLFVKRALVASTTFGDAAYHRDRYATSKNLVRQG